jgi:hypothetical protein
LAIDLARYLETSMEIHWGPTKARHLEKYSGRSTGMHWAQKKAMR